jgi:hypothetical protein
LCSGCISCLDPDGEDCIKKYNFTIPISIYPVRDTFHVGDTIWVESLVQNNLVNNLTGEEVNISNLDLKFDLYISEYTDTSDRPSRDIFKIENQIGGFQPYGSFFSRINFAIDNNHRNFKAGLVPTEKGVDAGTFCLIFDYVVHDYEQSDILNKNCLDLISFNYLTNQGRDSNSYKLLPSTFSQANTQADFNRGGCFAFRVVD